MSVDDTMQTITLGGEETAAADTPRPRFWYSRFWMDLTGTFRCDPSFQPIDVLHKTDGSTETKAIDILASFSPPIGMKTENKTAFACTKAAVVVWKLLVFLLNVAIFLTGFVPFPRAIWFWYLTNWALFIAMIYSGLSLANTIFPVSTSSSSDSNDPKNTTETVVISTRTKITWAIFTLAAVAQTMVTVLYWALLHPPGLPFLFLVSMIMLHGGVCVLILVDGLLVNRIPIRLRHWFEVVLPLFLAWIIWSVLQSPLGFDLNNTYMEAFGADDDKIYPVIDWESKPMMTLALVSVCGFIVSPIVHFALSALSFVGRKYIDVKGEGDVENQDSEDVEDLDEDAVSA